MKRTPLQSSSKRGAKVDIESADGTTALMIAARSGVPASVELLLSAGADPTKKDKNGKTAVDYARNGEESNALKGAALILAFLFVHLPANVGPKFLGHIANSIQHNVGTPDTQRVA